MNNRLKFRMGDRVEKTTGDYVFRGDVRTAFRKRSGAPRYVVENDDGLLHIFSDGNLQRIEAAKFEDPEEGDL